MRQPLVEVWCLDITQAPPLRECRLFDLNEFERCRLHRFKRVEDQHAFAITRLALRHLLAAHAGGLPGDVPLSVDARGKPWSVAAAAPFFSVSHSNGQAVIALCQAFHVGIDLEACSSFRESSPLWPLVCSATESDWLASDRSSADTRFGQLWTRKEAILKALGIGLTGDLTKVDLGDDVGRREGGGSITTNGAYVMFTWKDLHLLAGYSSTVAAVLDKCISLTTSVRSFPSNCLISQGRDLLALGVP